MNSYLSYIYAMKKKQRILVSGSTGQLGSELKHISKDFPQFALTFKTRKGMDLSSSNSIKKALREKKYDFFINAGAYTAVDKAESDKSTAHKVNAEALSHIAKHCPKSTKIIHISSDYVYHISPLRPIEETDKVSPQSVYAKTKLKGERDLFKLRPDSVVMRTSWVYSSYGNNFVKTMLRLGKDRDSLHIVADQYGAPTYARDIATTLLHMIDRMDMDNIDDIPKSGIFNYSNLGLTNWADFAREIFRQAGIKCKVGETTTKAYNAPAPRPLWSMLSKEKIQRAYHIEIPEWRDSLNRCLSELGYR